MKVELFNILNELEELAENCFRIPFTRRVMIDEDKLLDCVDRLRSSLPEEMRQAKWMLQERDKVMADTNTDMIFRRAN